VAGTSTKEDTMRTNVTSILVDDQEKALRFYTDVLGFVKKTDMPLRDHPWLTVVSPQQRNLIQIASRG
jgi:catechol 2,3-dioxygenase-like lactoylglutathione lyase family enzyme